MTKFVVFSYITFPYRTAVRHNFESPWSPGNFQLNVTLPFKPLIVPITGVNRRQSVTLVAWLIGEELRYSTKRNKSMFLLR